MAERYVLKFSKGGYAKYTSHLDLLRFFKRAFRKTGIDLRYSQGFNPHPKLGFAQPLSLGYSGAEELLEFETDTYNEPEKIMELLKPEMPEGLEIKQCDHLDLKVKSLAGEAESADYTVMIPFEISREELESIILAYLDQDEIKALKRRKKDKKMIETDIKKQIRKLEGTALEKMICLNMQLDCGSISNCSPELVILSFCRFAELDIPRYSIDVERKKIRFYNNLQI